MSSVFPWHLIFGIHLGFIEAFYCFRKINDFDFYLYSPNLKIWWTFVSVVLNNRYAAHLDLDPLSIISTWKKEVWDEKELNSPGNEMNKTSHVQTGRNNENLSSGALCVFPIILYASANNRSWTQRTISTALNEPHLCWFYIVKQ